ncbi:hypothetical protein BH10BAC2_BH10BAC2_35100 [soil metagenome]
MKTPLIFISLLLAICPFFYSAESGKVNYKKNTTAELTDLQGIVFARNLLDWKGRPIDSLQMDIYYPTGATSDKKYPVILFCHAGGFSGGNRFNVAAICDRFADDGFIAVAFDYRVGYRKGRDGHSCDSDSTSLNKAVYRSVQDANSCFRYLVSNANALNIDTSWLFIGGSSAGGVLSQTDAYMTDSTAQIYYPYCVSELGGIQSSGNNYTNKYSVKGVISMWGALSYANTLIDTNYRTYPTILFKGEEDGGIPDSVGSYKGCVNLPILYAGVALYTKLLSQNTPVVFHQLPLGNHPAYDDVFCVQNSVCFLKALMEGRPYSGSYNFFEPSCR